MIGLLTRIIAAGGCAGSTAIALCPVTTPAYARDQRRNSPGARDEPGAAAHSRLAVHARRTVIIGLRPEDLPAAADGHVGPALAGDADLAEALGAELMVHFTVDACRIRAEGG
jgi:hypothetical protein